MALIIEYTYIYQGHAWGGGLTGSHPHFSEICKGTKVCPPFWKSGRAKGVRPLKNSYFCRGERGMTILDDSIKYRSTIE